VPAPRDPAGILRGVSDPITIRDLDEDERAWANERYQDIQFAVTPPDAVALVAELAGVRVGLGRLVLHAPGVLELGGIWTDPSVRHRGIARAMVAALIARLPPQGSEPASGGPAGPGDARATTSDGSPVWCIPFAHLAAFYQSFGFAPCPPPWPAAVAAKVAACAEQQLPEVVVLAR
jgi:GNAT superfamily N-acetyltransferase